MPLYANSTACAATARTPLDTQKDSTAGRVPCSAVQSQGHDQRAPTQRPDTSSLPERPSPSGNELCQKDRLVDPTCQPTSMHPAHRKRAACSPRRFSLRGHLYRERKALPPCPPPRNQHLRACISRFPHPDNTAQTSPRSISPGHGLTTRPQSPLSPSPNLAPGATPQSHSAHRRDWGRRSEMSSSAEQFLPQHCFIVVHTYEHLT